MSWFKDFLKNFGGPEENFGSNFTPRAQQVLALARKEADRLHHNYLGTEHILLGLMALGQGVAVNVLTGMGLNLENVRTEVEKLTGTGPDENSGATAPYTPRVKKVLDLARREAKALHHTYIGTEHLLLGLLREGNGLAAIALRNFNVDLEQTRVSIVKELDPNFISGDEFRNKQFLPDAVSNFTPRAQQVLTLARKEAARFHHNYLGSEHVLLGLLALGQGVAVNVLRKFGADLENIRKEVERLAPAQTEGNNTGTTLFSPQVEKVLTFAREEAKALHHVYIGTEHLFLGLLREVDGAAVTALKHLGIDIEQARVEVLKELNPNFIPNENALKDWVESAKEHLDKGNSEAGQLTPRAQQVLAFAREEAERLHHNYLGTEHVLLGLIKLNIGLSAIALKGLGLMLENTRKEVEKLAGIGPDKKMFGSIPYTPRTTRILDVAKKEAKALNHTYIGTEHLLLGLLGEHEGLAAEIFKIFKVDTEQLRQKILNELKPPGNDAQKG